MWIGYLFSLGSLGSEARILFKTRIVELEVELGPRLAPVAKLVSKNVFCRMQGFSSWLRRPPLLITKHPIRFAPLRLCVENQKHRCNCDPDSESGFKTPELAPQSGSKIGSGNQGASQWMPICDIDIEPARI
jgi:hypothetical protein